MSGRPGGRAMRRDSTTSRHLALAAIRPPDDDIRIPVGARTHVIDRDQFAEWLEIAKSGTSPLNQRRERMRSLAQRELLRRTGSEDTWRQAAALKAAINTAWPTQKPVRLVDRLLPGPSGKRRAWTRADQLLVDEANSMLNGSPFTYGHVIVDEAQDHSAVGTAGDRAAQPDRLDDPGRRRRPVDHPGRPGTVVGGVRPPHGARAAGGNRRRPHDRLSCARADPGGGQPTAGAHRRRRHREPQRASYGGATELAAGHVIGSGRRRCRPGGGDEAAPADQCRRRATGAPRRDRRRARCRTGSSPSITCTNSTLRRSRCSARRP